LDEPIKTLVYTLYHQRLVQQQMLKIAHEIEKRAFRHDNSKLDLTEEFEGLVEINYIAREKGFGSKDYQDSLKSKMTQHHWRVNDHHPEHFPRGISDMDLVQIIEMVVDWYAVSIQKNLNFYDMQQEQKKRFNPTSEEWYLIQKVVEWLIS
jgi:hypothetical protein